VVLALLGAVLLGTCTDGKDLAGPVGESHVLLSMGSDLLAALVPDEARPIQRIRITAEEVPGGARLGEATQEVDPQAQEWTLDFSLSIPVESTVVVTLSVELLSLSTGTPLVEWSGRTGPITLQVGTVTEIQDIPLVKGPLSNLAVTEVSIEEPVPDIREGESAQLTAVASTTTPQDPPTIFWRSLNPGVATVSGTGLVQAVLPGLARIVATAGAAADTVTVTVLQSPASVALNPDGAVLDALGAEVAFEATVLDPRGEPIPGEGVTWDVADAAVLDDLGAGAFRARGRGTTTVHATSLLDPAVSGSAEVVVRQVVAAVDVIPEEAEVFIGDAVQFEAVAFDANENPIEGMTFSWSTSDPSVASVDEGGLAAGIEAGTATIVAEALSSGLGTAEAGSLAPTPGTTGFATLVVLPPVARVAILPNPFTFRSLGELQAFTARAYGLDDSGEPTKLLPLTDFTWESLNQSVMTVEAVGLTSDTAFVRSVANGSTVLRATLQGVTGSTPVFVAQRIEEVGVSPSTWTFSCVVGAGCQEKVFTGRAYDAEGSLVSGTVFVWSSSEYCFEILDPVGGKASGTATVTDNCGCDTSPGDLTATTGSVSGLAYLYPPPCTAASLPTPPRPDIPTPADLASALPPESPFRLGIGSF
jgi:hypothetical protein